MRTSIRRGAVVAATVVAAMSFSTGTASASHDHFIYQPGHGNHPATCRWIAAGQTNKAADDPGGHKFHAHVHTGQPGSDAHGTDFDRGATVTAPSNEGNYDCVWANTP